MKSDKILKSIVITGASSGIGKYATKVFSDRGWIVWAGYRNARVSSLLLQINPQLVRPILIDVTDIRSITKARKIIVDSGIPLKVLCNNAGVAFGSPIELIDVTEVQKAFDVNFFGAIRMIQVFLPLLRQTSGRIINISSISGLVGIPFLVPTSSSKFALEGMSDSLRRELKNQNVSVSVIEPALIKSSIWDKSIRLSNQVLKGKNTLLIPYKPSIDNLLTLLTKNSKIFRSLQSIKKPLLHAAESKYPKIRYLVYPANSALKLFIKVLPDKLQDFIFKLLL